jgi:hypothetical protein
VASNDIIGIDTDTTTAHVMRIRMVCSCVSLRGFNLALKVEVPVEDRIEI